MLTHFGLASEMPVAGSINLDTTDTDCSPVRYLVPWYLQNERPKTLNDNWPFHVDPKQVLKSL